MENKVHQIVFNISIEKWELLEGVNESLIELGKEYLNDLNSSSMREMVMTVIAGCTYNPKKLGYDGLNSKDEMKPKNVRSNSKNRLNIGGNYSDMTWKRHFKFMEENPTIYAGGFVDGLLVFQLSFSYRDLSEHFEKQIQKILPNGDEKNKYVRSMGFGMKQVMQYTKPKVLFISANLDKFRGNMTKDLYTYLKSNI
jgi:hypothetical protein